MEKRPVILPECVETVCDKRFVRVFDLRYAPGKHYYDASRHPAQELVALKSDEEAAVMLPDAVSCVVILQQKEEEPRLLLSWEYRYPAGRFLLSVPAGLIDPEDRDQPEPLIRTALRELKEETGLDFGPRDTARVIAPFLYSTPGMTDEANGLVELVLHPENLDGLNQAGALGSELFDGFELLTREDALRHLREGRDKNGQFYSIFTWAALMHFVSGRWQEGKA